MKNLIPLLLLSIILVSCKKEVANNEGTSEKIEQIKSMTNVSEKIVAFNMLTNNEKAMIWKSHLEDALKEYTLTSKQIDLINESINIISSEIYNKETKDKFSGELSILSFRAQKEFSIIEYARIFHSLNRKTSPTSTTDLTVKGDCKCASNFSCLLGNLTVCNTVNSCDPTETGCGLFGTSNCTGVCGESSET